MCPESAWKQQGRTLAKAPKFAVVVALRREVDELLSGEAEAIHYLQGNKFPTYVFAEFSITCAGIGGEAASRVTKAVIQQFNPEVVVSAGFAGAVDPMLGIGHVIMPGKVIDEVTGASFLSMRGDGVLVSAAKVVDAEGKAFLRQRYGAMAVDMEAAAVAEQATRHGIPFLTVKSISDTAETSLPDFSRFIRRDGSFATTSFVAHMIFHPTLWPAVRRLGADTEIATKSLASSLRQPLADMSRAISTLEASSQFKVKSE